MAWHYWLLSMRAKWADLGRLDNSWAQYWRTDGDGFVRMRTLLSGDVSTFASEIMFEDERRDHTYRADYTQRMRDGL